LAGDGTFKAALIDIGQRRDNLFGHKDPQMQKIGGRYTLSGILSGLWGKTLLPKASLFFLRTASWSSPAEWPQEANKELLWQQSSSLSRLKENL